MTRAAGKPCVAQPGAQPHSLTPTPHPRRHPTAHTSYTYSSSKSVRMNCCRTVPLSGGHCCTLVVPVPVHLPTHIQNECSLRYPPGLRMRTHNALQHASSMFTVRGTPPRPGRHNATAAPACAGRCRVHAQHPRTTGCACTAHQAVSP